MGRGGKERTVFFVLVPYVILSKPHTRIFYTQRAKVRKEKIKMEVYVIDDDFCECECTCDEEFCVCECFCPDIDYVEDEDLYEL